MNGLPSRAWHARQVADAWAEFRKAVYRLRFTIVGWIVNR